MYSKMLSGCVHGVEGKIVEVEVDISRGLPQTTIVGLPDAAVKESVERVRSAIKNCGFTYPMERITVNLAPADLRKEGSAFDLSIAAGILAASGQISTTELKDMFILGELSLDGNVRPVPGVLAMVDEARKRGISRILLPASNAAEGTLLQGVSVFCISHLSELRQGLKKWDALAFKGNSKRNASPVQSLEDYLDVKGQKHAKRALMIAASGMHNVLFIGPPGTGKTMLMRRLPTILPPMDESEAIEVTKIYSVAEKKENLSELMRIRPFRAPHHTISQTGLIGGGSIPKPGEVSLAHRGVLFLDELPEFSRNVLEGLRQPLEDRRVTISRARATYTFPAQFMLAAAMNPCPCGYLGSRRKDMVCSCSWAHIHRYRNKISGPLLDRIDLQVEVPLPESLPASGKKDGMDSAYMRQAVMKARNIQQRRYLRDKILFNSELSGIRLQKACPMDEKARNLLDRMFHEWGLSLRTYDRILKISRTIADLEESEEIKEIHLAEALEYRSLDRRGNGF